jgi:hypothetical protein
LANGTAAGAVNDLASQNIPQQKLIIDRFSMRKSYRGLFYLQGA